MLLWRAAHQIRPATFILLSILWFAATISACAGDSATEPSAVAAPSIEQIVDAVRRPGQVFHTVARATQDGYGAQAPTIIEQWYSEDDAATRTESTMGGGPPDNFLSRDDREYFAGSDAAAPPMPARTRPAGAPDGGIAGLDHLSFFFADNGYSYTGTASRDGDTVLIFTMTRTVTADTDSELPVGTSFRLSAALRAGDFMPVEMQSVVDTSGVPTPQPPVTAGPKLPTSRLDYQTVEFIYRASLPADFFDPAALVDRRNQ